APLHGAIQQHRYAAVGAEGLDHVPARVSLVTPQRLLAKIVNDQPQHAHTVAKEGFRDTADRANVFTIRVDACPSHNAGTRVDLSAAARTSSAAAATAAGLVPTIRFVPAVTVI